MTRSRFKELKLPDYSVQEAIATRFKAFDRRPRLHFYQEEATNFETAVSELAIEAMESVSFFDIQPYKSLILLARDFHFHHQPNQIDTYRINHFSTRDQTSTAI